MTKKARPLPEKPMQSQKDYPICSFQKVTEIIKTNCGNVYVSERHGKGFNKIIILPEATKELEAMIAYGRKAPINVREQKYLGYGHFLTDENGGTITIVKHFIEIQTVNRSSTGASNLGPNGEKNPGIDFLQYYREEFLKYEDRLNTDAEGNMVDPFMSMCGSSEYVLEGHTHPDLGVFYSSTDRISGTARAGSKPICIFVCDPIRKKMLGSTGKDFMEAEVIVYSKYSYSPEEVVDYMGCISPTDKIVQLANGCIKAYGYEGNIKVRRRRNGKAVLKLKLNYPMEDRLSQ